MHNGILLLSYEYVCPKRKKTKFCVETIVLFQNFKNIQKKFWSKTKELKWFFENSESRSKNFLKTVCGIAFFKIILTHHMYLNIFLSISKVFREKSAFLIWIAEEGWNSNNKHYFWFKMLTKDGIQIINFILLCKRMNRSSKWKSAYFVEPNMCANVQFSPRKWPVIDCWTDAKQTFF